MKMKCVALLSGLLCGVLPVFAESGVFRVEGDENLFYPVTFLDARWHDNLPTELYISRHNVHLDEMWRGAMSARFDYHVSLWGNGAEYIRARVQGNDSPSSAFHDFVAGWQDGSFHNATMRMVVWLRGAMTYYWSANGEVAPQVYDGVANPLPYAPDGQEVFEAKTAVEDYVRMAAADLQSGNGAPSLRIGEVGDAGNTNVPLDSVSQRLPLDFTGYRDMAPDQVGARIEGVRYNSYRNGESYVQRTGLAFYTNPSGLNGGDADLLQRMVILPDGRVGVGTPSPDYELTVNGTVHAKEVVIDLQGAQADDVYESGYPLRPLEEVRGYIRRNGHLPDVPSASEVASGGMALGQFENLLLRKIEELTLYTLQLQAEIEALRNK